MEVFEYRLKQMEEAIDTLGKKVSTLEASHAKDIEQLKKEIVDDYQNLTVEFKDLQQEFAVSRTEVFDKIAAFKDMPKLMQELKESIIGMNAVLGTTKAGLETVEKALDKVKDRGKFDILMWCRDNMIPTLLGFGILYFVLHATGAI